MTFDTDGNLHESVRRARRGDVEAFGRLVRATERMVLGVCRRVCGETADALDAVQEAYIVAFRRLGDLQDESAFATWLRRVAITCAIDVRRRRRDTFLQVGDLAAVPVLDDRETRWSPGQRAALARALLELNLTERRLCSRHYHWGWSIARLAADAGVSETAMRKRLQRVRDRLRRMIEMQEQRDREEVLPTHLPERIVELLSRPCLVDVPENPVGRVLDRLKEAFAGFTLVELPELIDLAAARRAMGFDPVYIDARYLHPIEGDRILRYDLSLPMLLTARSTEEPLRLWSAGKVYRNDGPSKTHLQAFHQLEVLELDESARLDGWTFGSRLLAAVEAVLPERSVRITPTQYAMCTKAWELSVEQDGSWTEVLAWGVYIPQVVEVLGGDPARQAALGAGVGLERLACVAFQIKDMRQVELISVAGG